VQYIPPSFPNHPQNKRETQNKKQNRKDIEDHSRPRCNVFEPSVSFDQSYHLAPLYSVKGVHNVAPIEHGKQTFHRSLCVPAVFPQDAPGVLNGADQSILVWIIHDRDSRRGRMDSFRRRAVAPAQSLALPDSVTPALFVEFDFEALRRPRLGILIARIAAQDQDGLIWSRPPIWLIPTACAQHFPTRDFLLAVSARLVPIVA
jgi:hypothetical protein